MSEWRGDEEEARACCIHGWTDSEEIDATLQLRILDTIRRARAAERERVEAAVLDEIRRLPREEHRTKYAQGQALAYQEVLSYVRTPPLTKEDT